MTKRQKTKTKREFNIVTSGQFRTLAMFCGKMSNIELTLWSNKYIYIMYYSTSESMKYEEMTCIFDRNKFLLFICIVLHTVGWLRRWSHAKAGAQNHVPTTDQPSTFSQIMTSFYIIIISINRGKTFNMEFAFWCFSSLTIVLILSADTNVISIHIPVCFLP